MIEKGGATQEDSPIKREPKVSANEIFESIIGHMAKIILV
jgi:hypothetical protein